MDGEGIRLFITIFSIKTNPLSRYLNIIITSLKMALQEFRSNKLRTFLSLLGITFGIFCIISVLATISRAQPRDRIGNEAVIMASR